MDTPTRATVDDVKRLAALARVEVKEADLTRFAEEFDAILAYVGKLDELTLPEAEGTLSPVRNVLREDGEPTASGTWTQKVTDQFPDRSGESLRVQRILNHE